MKKILTILLMLMMVIAMCGCGSNEKNTDASATPSQKSESIVGKKTLIVYFSLSGNTETAAKDVQRIIGKADLLKLKR